MADLAFLMLTVAIFDLMRTVMRILLPVAFLAALALICRGVIQNFLVRALGIHLRARGWDVAAATNGAEALDLAASWHPEVVLLDLGLPDISGLDVIAGIRG